MMLSSQFFTYIKGGPCVGLDRVKSQIWQHICGKQFHLIVSDRNFGSPNHEEVVAAMIKEQFDDMHKKCGCMPTTSPAPADVVADKRCSPRSPQGESAGESDETKA